MDFEPGWTNKNGDTVISNIDKNTHVLRCHLCGMSFVASSYGIYCNGCPSCRYVLSDKPMKPDKVNELLDPVKMFKRMKERRKDKEYRERLDELALGKKTY